MANKRDLQGRVEGVNDNGVKIGGAWFNFSKFFEGERTPDKGVVVSAVVDDYKGKDYLCKLEVIGSALPSGGGNTPVASSGGGSYASRSAETQLSIHRQVALKVAVEYTTEVSGAVPVAEVIATARAFERFLNEPFGQDADVEEAA